MIGEPEELKLSEKTTVFVAELDGWEQDLADGILCQLLDAAKDAEPSQRTLTILQTKVYSVGSIRKINGDGVAPLHSKFNYAKLAARLTLAERNVLGFWAAEKYLGSLVEIKNEAAGPSEDPSQD